MSRIAAVTGVTGHVGLNLVRALHADGWTVRGLVHHGPPPEGVEGVKGDVLDRDSLAPLYEGAEVVFHLAAVISIRGDKGGLVQRVNVDGVRNSAQAAAKAGVRRFVHTSSVHAFDTIDRGVPIDESTGRATEEHPAYDQSKAAGERALREVEDLDFVVCNPTGIMGPHDPGTSRINKVLRDLRDRRLPALLDGGFNWVDSRDVAAGLLAAADRGEAGGNYLLGGHWASLQGLAGHVHEVTGSKPPLVTTPMWLAKIFAPISAMGSAMIGREGAFVPEALMPLEAAKEISTARAERDLGWAPRPLGETVRDYFQWLDA